MLQSCYSLRATIFFVKGAAVVYLSAMLLRCYTMFRILMVYILYHTFLGKLLLQPTPRHASSPVASCVTCSSSALCCSYEAIAQASCCMPCQTKPADHAKVHRCPSALAVGSHAKSDRKGQEQVCVTSQRGVGCKWLTLMTNMLCRDRAVPSRAYKACLCW